MGDPARSIRHVVPPVPDCEPVSEGKTVVAAHVAESADPVVGRATVQFDQQLILVIAHIAAIGQTQPAFLPVARRQSVRSLHVVEVAMFDGRLGALGDVAQELPQQPPTRLSIPFTHSAQDPGLR